MPSIEKTLTWVSGVGEKPDQYGNYYVNVSFSDDTAGFIGGKPEKVEEHWVALTALLDHPGEFSLEEKGTTGKGKTKFKINAYPGWERQASDSGSSGSGKSSWYNSEEGVRFTQERTDRRTALMQAVEAVDSQSNEFIPTADRFYDWLRKNLDVSAPRLVQGRSPTGAGFPEDIGRDGVARVGADTPLDGGGATEYGMSQGKPPSASGKLEDSPPPSSTKQGHAAKWTPNKPPDGWK